MPTALLVACVGLRQRRAPLEAAPGAKTDVTSQQFFGVGPGASLLLSRPSCFMSRHQPLHSLPGATLHLPELHNAFLHTLVQDSIAENAPDQRRRFLRTRGPDGSSCSDVFGRVHNPTCLRPRTRIQSYRTPVQRHPRCRKHRPSSTSPLPLRTPSPHPMFRKRLPTPPSPPKTR